MRVARKITVSLFCLFYYLIQFFSGFSATSLAFRTQNHFKANLEYQINFYFHR